MTRILTGTLAAIMFVVAAATAFADEPGKIVAGFGLLGTWSSECSRALTDPCSKERFCPSRVTFAVPADGKPTINSTVGGLPNGKTIDVSRIIETASLIGGDKIKFSFVVIGDPAVIPPMQKSLGMVPGKHWLEVILKTGDKFRTFSLRRDDGKKILDEDGYANKPTALPTPGELPAGWVKARETEPLAKCAN
jgi:hypothetical protein